MKVDHARTVPFSKGSRGRARTSGRSGLPQRERIEPLVAAAITCLVLSTVVWVPGGLVRFVLPKLLLATIGIGLALWARPFGRLPRAVTIVLTASVGVLVLAALVGAQPLSQLMGRWPRYEGLVALPVYLGAMWAGARLLNIDAPESHWRFLTRIAGVAAAALGAVAVLEAAGLQPLGGTSARLGGLSGNATDQGVCGLLLAMLLVTPALHRGGDWFARIGLAGSILAVVLSGSRGAMLGLAVAGAGLVAMSLLRRRTPPETGPRDRTNVGPLTAAIVAVSIGVAFAVPAVRSRLLLTDTGAGGTVQGRGLLWSESLTLWTEHPWLGTGPSGFVDAITAQHTEEWATNVGSANPPDSPHSWPLQALLSGGPILLVLALLLGSMVVWTGWRAFAAAHPESRSASNGIASGGALAAVVGFGVALLTHFTAPSTTILAALLCGALVSSARSPAQDGKHRQRARAGRWLGSALAAAFAAVVLVATTTEWSMERAISAVQRGDLQTADEAFHMSEGLRPWDADVALLAATALSRQTIAEPSHPDQNGVDPTGLSLSALAWAERAVDRLPESSEAALALATAQEATGDLSSALNTYQRLQALSPTNALVWQRQGVVQAETGAFPAAEASLLKAARLSPTSPEPWQNLAMLYDLMNRPNDKAAALLRAENLGP